MVEIIITNNDANRRLDKFLRKYLCNASLGQIYKIIRKDLKINGRRQNESYILLYKDKLCFYLSDNEFNELTKKKAQKNSKAKKQFDVIYEDDNILTVNKPFGLLTHGDSNEKKNHLTNQVVDYLIENGDYVPHSEKVFTPAPVNRLDRNTTGLVLFGKNASSLKAMNEMIRKDMIKKYYLTIVHGIVKEDLVLDGILYKDSIKNKVSVSHHQTPRFGDSGLQIKTIVKPLQILNRKYTLVEVELATGRSHQIRAHMASIGHPIIGDVKYATRPVINDNKILQSKYKLSTQILHAYKLTIASGVTPLNYLIGKNLYADLPKSFKQILNDLGGNNIIYNNELQ